MCVDIGVIENCKNPDSYGEICVRCNKCGRFDKENYVPMSVIEDIKAEIEAKFITHGQVVDGEYFAEDAEYINHGLNMALEIIDKHIRGEI